MDPEWKTAPPCFDCHQFESFHHLWFALSNLDSEAEEICAGFLLGGFDLEECYAFTMKRGVHGYERMRYDLEHKGWYQTLIWPRALYMKVKGVDVYQNEMYVFERPDEEKLPECPFEVHKGAAVWIGDDPEHVRRDRYHVYRNIPVEESELDQAQLRLYDYYKKWFLYEMASGKKGVYLQKRHRSDPNRLTKGPFIEKNKQEFGDYVPSLKYKTYVGSNKHEKKVSYAKEFAATLPGECGFTSRVIDLKNPNPSLSIDQVHRSLNLFQGTTKDLPDAWKFIHQALRKVSPLPYLMHLYIVRTGGSIRDFVWFLLTQVHMVQNVGEMQPFYLRFVGPQGTGKTNDMWLAGAHIPTEYRKTVNEIDDFIGSGHTMDMSRALVMFLDENSSINKAQMNRLKNFVTSPVIRNRKMYQDVEDVRCTALPIFTSDDPSDDSSCGKPCERRELVMYSTEADEDYIESSKSKHMSVYFNYLHSGELSVTANEYTQLGQTEYEQLTDVTHNEMLEKPGMLSYYAFRIAVKFPTTNPYSDCLPTSTTLLHKQITKEGREKLNKYKLFMCLEQNSFTFEDPGIHLDSWNPHYAGFRNRLIQLKVLQEIRLWGDILEKYEQLRIDLDLEHQIEIPDIVDGLWPPHLVTLRDDLESDPEPLLPEWPKETGDPYGRDEDALLKMRNLWNVETLSVRRSLLIRILSTPIEWQDMYKKVLTEMMLLDDEMSMVRSLDTSTNEFFKCCVAPQTLLSVKTNTQKRLNLGNWQEKWSSLCGAESCKLLSHEEGSDKYKKLRSMLLNRELSDSVWVIPKMRAYIFQADAKHKNFYRKDMNSDNPPQHHCFFVPSWAQMRIRFLKKYKTEAHFFNEKVFILNENSTVLKKMLNPWTVCETTMKLLFSGQWKTVRDLTSKILLAALKQEEPDWKQVNSFQMYKIKEELWRLKWEAYDAGKEGTLMVDEIQKFINLPNCFQK